MFLFFTLAFHQGGTIEIPSLPHISPSFSFFQVETVYVTEVSRDKAPSHISHTESPYHPGLTANVLEVM